jgi:hypothetical protein
MPHVLTDVDESLSFAEPLFYFSKKKNAIWGVRSPPNNSIDDILVCTMRERALALELEISRVAQVSAPGNHSGYASVHFFTFLKRRVLSSK